MKKNELSDLARFIIVENYRHHQAGLYSEENFGKEIDRLLHEDLSCYDQSHFFVIEQAGHITGSIKVTRCGPATRLPLYDLFDLSYAAICHRFPPNVALWHVGRFAISKNGANGYLLLKKLLTIAIYSICQDPNSIMLAECDVKLIRALKKMGIQVSYLAPPVLYLGSATAAIYATQQGLANFLKGNSYVEEILTAYEEACHSNQLMLHE